ncbi:MAG: ABC transporter ATP-binding protein [Lachnospiraceae bacterium]
MLEFQNFSFQYEEREEVTLKDINLMVRDGEFVLLTGRSGCGKTTLMRALNGLIPHFYPGNIQGELRLNGASLLEMKPSELAGKIGTVFQDPRSQFFMTDTTRELAFGCENMGYDREETVARVAGSVSDLKLQEYLNKSIFALSSGEKQQIAIGSVYAMTPQLYIFDEPSANLDYDAAKRLAGTMKRLKEAGITVLVVEHRFYYLRELIDKAVWIQNGTIMREYTKDEFCRLDPKTRTENGLRTVYPEREINEQFSPDFIPDTSEPQLFVSNLNYYYQKEQAVLSGLNFTAGKGDITGIVGHNGAGKTTLLSIMTGIMQERSGEIRYQNKKLSAKQRRKLSYLVMQDTDYQLFGSSVAEELTLGINELKEENVTATLNALELSQYKECHPASLSGGQKQRVTIGAAIMKDSPIIYFDEPTSGLDYDSMIRVSGLIRELAKQGAIVFIVSHDFEFITRTCTRLLQLDEQEISQNLPITEDALKRLAQKYFN